MAESPKKTFPNNSHIETDDVAFDKNTLARKTVHDLFIHGTTKCEWVSKISLESRLDAILVAQIASDFLEIQGLHARPDGFAQGIENDRHDSSSFFHGLDLSIVLDENAAILLQSYCLPFMRPLAISPSYWREIM